MGNLTLAFYGLTGRRMPRLKPMVNAHHHQEVELNVMVSGEVTYLHGGSIRTIRPGSLAFFWAAVPHHLVTASDDADLIWMTLPLPMVRSWGLHADLMAGLLQGDWLLGPQGSDRRFPVVDWVAELNSGNSRPTTGLELELHGCLHWLGERLHPQGPAPAPNDQDLLPVGTMARYMAEHSHEKLTVPDIAQTANLHPKYAMALFRRRCGMTIHDYLTRLRVTHAQRLLMEGDTSVIHIALACGFGTQSAFYDAFQRRVGMTPKAYRLFHRRESRDSPRKNDASEVP